MSKTSIIVNGTEEFWTDSNITYEQVVQIAFPGSPHEQIFSVTYATEGGETGSLAHGKILEVKNGTRFEVVATYRS